MKLHNIYDKETLVKLLAEEGKKRTTLSFYRYAKIENPEFFRNHLFATWSELGVFGRVYVAKEGINAQVSVPSENFQAYHDLLESITFLQGNRLNVAVDDKSDSFLKLKIKVRDKILADGLNDETFDVTNRGVHLSAKEFNELTSKEEETIIIDMRNHYESEIGHFKNAVTPDVDSFRDSLPIIEEMLQEHKEKNIVMYCTGGIRCEKASAYFKHRGLKNVYQLDGGIIEYARQCENEGLENKFIGKNFVFDERRAEKISEEIISVCHQCGDPFDVHTNCANVACNLLFLQCDKCKETMNHCCSDECKDIVALPEEKQKELRKGRRNSNKIFKKGRSESLKFKK